MNIFDTVLVVTHIVYRKKPPYEPVEGPYSECCSVLELMVNEVQSLQVPLSGFNDPITYGKWKKEKRFSVPKILGIILPLKYLTDMCVILFYTTTFCIKNRNKNIAAIGIDPLSCLPLVFLKKVFKYKLVFYSIDFSKSRLANKLMQKLYEKADEIDSRNSNQTWTTCELVGEYKKSKYGTESYYVPHATIFNNRFFEDGKKFRTGNKMAWTGSLLTNRLFDIIFGVLKKIQNDVKPDMEFYFAPTRDHEKIEEYCKKYELKKYQVLDLHSRLEWQEFASTCDVGIALYDELLGITEFVEPVKIWDYLLCGLPFVVSSEPSISKPIKESGVAYFLNPRNKIPNDGSLEKFLTPKNIKEKQLACLEIAKEYDISKQIELRLSALQKGD